MGKASASRVNEHRKRMSASGLVRLEVRVPKVDTALMREVASALSDPSRSTEVRKLLHSRLVQPPVPDLKELLASAPLEGLDLHRPHDLGRAVDL